MATVQMREFVCQRSVLLLRRVFSVQQQLVPHIHLLDFGLGTLDTDQDGDAGFHAVSFRRFDSNDSDGWNYN